MATASDDSYGSSGVGQGLPELSAPYEALKDGFRKQASGHYVQAFLAYRRAQNAKSPVMRVLASNAEGLLLLRAPGLITLFRAPGFASTPDLAGIPFESLSCGDAIIAPWAGDGTLHPAVISSMDEAAGECIVDWDDGGDTHRTVSLASVTTKRGGISKVALSQHTQEVRMWASLRAQKLALEAWNVQADGGTTHDAFVDLVGILSDLGIAEVRAALASVDRRSLSDGLRHAHRHMQRARFSAERAWAPDVRALAVICHHRADLIRLMASTAVVPNGMGVWNIRASKDTRESLKEALDLHGRMASHLGTCQWNSPVEGNWFQFQGKISPAVVHELSWAKTLAAQAATMPDKDQRNQKRPHAARKGCEIRIGSRNPGWSLPEKLIPPKPGLPVGEDVLLRETCPSRAAAGRAWRALCAAAGEPLAPEAGAGGLWTADSAEVRRLATAVGAHAGFGFSDDASKIISSPSQQQVEPLDTTLDNPQSGESQPQAFEPGAGPLYKAGAPNASRSAVGQAGAPSRLLLEVSVIIFSMGCKLGRRAWARSIAAPLADLASAQLGTLAQIDDSDLAAKHTSAVLAGSVLPEEHRKRSSRATILSTSLSRQSEKDVADNIDVIAPSRCRWRLAGYMPVEELWIFRIGARRTVHLAAPTALTWTIDGMALSETATALTGQEP